MRRAKKLWPVALALSLLLTCTACDAVNTKSLNANADKAQAESVIGKKTGTAKTENKSETKSETKSESKTDAKTETEAATEDKTSGTAKTEETKQQTESEQQTETKQDTSSKQVIDPSTGKDKYQTDPVPEGKPAPVEPEDTTVDTGTSHTCTFYISCSSILDNWDAWDAWDEEVAKAKKPLVPSDGVILPTTTVTFSEGESVFDVLQRVCRENKIHMDANWSSLYNTAYVKGINNLYEFDVGSGSGWTYCVNGWFPNYGCSRYELQDGDSVEWHYISDLG